MAYDLVTTLRLGKSLAELPENEPIQPRDARRAHSSVAEAIFQSMSRGWNSVGLIGYWSKAPTSAPKFPHEHHWPLVTTSLHSARAAPLIGYTLLWRLVLMSRDRWHPNEPKDCGSTRRLRLFSEPTRPRYPMGPSRIRCIGQRWTYKASSCT